MYRLIVESLLGLRLEVDKLRFVPCLPVDWKEFKIHYRYRETIYHIAVMQTHAAKDRITVILEGIERNDETIPLVDDRQEHWVDLRIFALQSTKK
jgi:cyclic beta-1,2-glucan synthetase